MLSALSRGAGVVLAAKQDVRVKHVEFVRIEPTRALAVLVAENGGVENRVIEIPRGLPTSALIAPGPSPVFPRPSFSAPTRIAIFPRCLFSRII